MSVRPSKNRKSEWIMLVVVIAVTLGVSLSAIKLYVPQWLGLPADLTLVRAAKEVPPFYDNVFRADDRKSKQFLINEPYTLIRTHPLLAPIGERGGPTDILGFRNSAVPGYADVLAIGDSQTFGTNASMAGNWPSQVQAALANVDAKLYAMASGGWGAIQYFYMVSKGLSFRPRVIVVAFYSGNDSLESYNVAHQVDYWRSFRESTGSSDDDLPPPIPFPAPKSTWWQVAFPDGSKMNFTPELRLRANQVEYPAVREGWNIMAKVAELLNGFSVVSKAHLVFTVIPTKELVYAKRLARDGISLDPKYSELIEKEQRNINELAQRLGRLSPRPDYVDLVGPMQDAALGNTRMYRSNINGHPVEAGYKVIADAIVPIISPYLQKVPNGLVKILEKNRPYEYFLVRGSQIYPFSAPQLVLDNGWKLDAANIVPERRLYGFLMKAPIGTVDHAKYGPTSSAD